MRTLGLATQRLQRLTERATAPIKCEHRQCCSHFLPRHPVQNVLILGAERPDEFADAVRLARYGHSVIVVNPRESIAARRFANAGGSFIRSTIERLPLTLGPFDLICENYPYTVAQVEGVCEDDPCPVWLSARAIRAYAVARLRHLAPDGRWILFTESPGFARALRSIVHRDPVIQSNFSSRIAQVRAGAAPPSSYPRLATRFKVVFQRYPTDRAEPVIWEQE
jgi:hypothetical protein